MTSINDHVRYLGIATIVYHALNLLVLLLIVPAIAAVNLFDFGDHPELPGIVGIILSLIAVILVAMSLPGLIGGVGLIKGKSWGKPFTIIGNIISVLNVPFGLALGVYTWWVLIKEDADAVLT